MGFSGAVEQATSEISSWKDRFWGTRRIAGLKRVVFLKLIVSLAPQRFRGLSQSGVRLRILQYCSLGTGDFGSNFKRHV
jgi:hypothetical protein